MTYQIVMIATGLSQAFAKINAIQNALQNKQDEIAFAATRGAASVWDDNFRSEGGSVGGWADLAERTVLEREGMGLPGEHPILIRYGDLQQVTTTSLMAVSGSATFSRTNSDGKRATVQVTSRGGTVNVMASGEKALNQNPTKYAPARPYWFVNSQVQQAARDAAIEKVVDIVGAA